MVEGLRFLSCCRRGLRAKASLCPAEEAKGTLLSDVGKRNLYLTCTSPVPEHTGAGVEQRHGIADVAKGIVKCPEVK